MMSVGHHFLYGALGGFEREGGRGNGSFLVEESNERSEC